MNKVENVTTYIFLLPDEIKIAIKADVVEALNAIGQYTEDNLKDAMDSRLCDLADLINVKKYL